jgi:hypothetical protein
MKQKMDALEKKCSRCDDPIPRANQFHTLIPPGSFLACKKCFSYMEDEWDQKYGDSYRVFLEPQETFGVFYPSFKG